MLTYTHTCTYTYTHMHIHTHTYTYTQRLQDKGYFRIPSVPSHMINNAHIFYIILPAKEMRLAVETQMKERGIAVFSHYVPLHSAPAGT